MQKEDNLIAEYRKEAGLFRLLPLGITRQVGELRISKAQINLLFYLKCARQLFPCVLGFLSASINHTSPLMQLRVQLLWHPSLMSRGG